MNIRAIPTTALLASFWGCHVFQDGTIDQTCEDLGNCAGSDGGDPDTDTDTDPVASLEWDGGIALSTTRGDGWRTTALAPPFLDAEVDRSGGGDGLAGPITYDDPHEVLWVLADGDLYGIGTGSEVRIADPGVEGAVDICYDDAVVYVAAGTSLAAWSTRNGATSEIEHPSSGAWADVSFVFRSADVHQIYFLDLGGAAPDLWKFDADKRAAELVYEDYDDSATHSSAGGFVGPDGGLYVCSSTGTIFSVDDLASATTSGGTPVPVAFLDAAVTDVVDCGWDDRAQRFLLFSASLGVVAIADGVDPVTVVEPTFGTIVGGEVW